MMSEAVSLARKNGSNAILSSLRDGLTAARSELETERIEKARSLILSGKPDDALIILEKEGEETAEVIDVKALALWDLGYREQAISNWMREYRKTGEAAPLKRLFWVLEQEGASYERTALRRFIAERFPGLAGILLHDTSRYNPDQMELISGLRINSNIKKVKNG